jgi:ketosteroid isomerase-like protein
MVTTSAERRYAVATPPNPTPEAATRPAASSRSPQARSAFDENVSAFGELASRLRPSRSETGPVTYRDPPDRSQQLNDLYSAFNRRDIPAVLIALAPDVSWPNGWEGGTVRGHQQVRDYWTRQWAQIDPTVLPMRYTTEGDGRIAVTVHQVVRTKDGRTIADEVVEHVYRFVKGLVSDMEIRK